LKYARNDFRPPLRKLLHLDSNARGQLARCIFIHFLKDLESLKMATDEKGEIT
jgi:hypothetical protein